MGNIKIEFKSQRGNNLEKKVLAVISSLKSSDTLDGAKNAFNHDFKKLKVGNHMRPENCYKLMRKQDGRVCEDWEKADSLEVWHETARGDLDRLVAIITEG